jgi:hypothetical protein
MSGVFVRDCGVYLSPRGPDVRAVGDASLGIGSQSFLENKERFPYDSDQIYTHSPDVERGAGT